MAVKNGEMVDRSGCGASVERLEEGGDELMMMRGRLIDLREM